MANKTQIKNFLESQKYLAVQDLAKERKEVLDNIVVDFKEKYKKDFEKIESNLVDAFTTLQVIANDMKSNNTGEYNIHYSGSPSDYIQRCIKQLRLGSIENYFEITEREKKLDYYSKKIYECKNEYNRLLATTKGMNAKDSYNLLVELGFDLSILETKKECTTVTTYFDASKLYIKKEDKI